MTALGMLVFTALALYMTRDHPEDFWNLVLCAGCAWFGYYFFG